MKRFRSSFLGAVALSLAFLTGAAFAADYPTKPIKIIVPFTPGSATDAAARAIGDRLQSDLGRPVIVENRPGAGGTVGAAVVATAAPDGYTLLLQSSGHTVNPFIYSSLPYDTAKDFAGVTTLATLPNVLVIAPSKGIKSVKELVAKAKANPGKLNYASAGAGSATHMNAEKFRVAAGFEAQHVPFKGTPEALNEVAEGRVDYFFAPSTGALPFIKDGRVLALAVGDAKRSSKLPDVPTTVEAGVPGSDYRFWVGLLVPAKTPRDVVKRLHDETLKALAAPEVKQRFANLGAEPMTMAPEAFDALIKEELKANEAFIKKAGIKLN